jgi:hypothetical protein
MNVNIKFKGVDWWGRPVYKVEDKEVYIGSTDTIFPDKEIAPNGTEEEINNYFRNNLDELVIFGTTFNEDDPLGTKIKNTIQLIII